MSKKKDDISEVEIQTTFNEYSIEELNDEDTIIENISEEVVEDANENN